MTRKDRVNAELAYEKQALFILFTAGLAMVAWLFSNRSNLTDGDLYIVFVAFVSNALITTLLHQRISAKIKELEKL